jgi:hypothetical protein
MQCQNHSDREAVAMCIRCRNFYCANCRTVINGKNYCLPCADKIQPVPAPEAPVTTPVAPPPVAAISVSAKKKSGCLKWAIIAIVITLCLAIFLVIAGLLIYRKVIAPNLQPQPEQQFAESTTAVSGSRFLIMAIIRG